MNLQLWILMITLAIQLSGLSVRVSNELGARCPKAAKFSVVVTAVTSTLFQILFTGNLVRNVSWLPASNNYFDAEYVPSSLAHRGIATGGGILRYSSGAIIFVFSHYYRQGTNMLAVAQALAAVCFLFTASFTHYSD